MSRAAKKNIYIEQNATFEWPLRYRSTAGYLDLTGYTFMGAIRKTATEKGPPLATFDHVLADQTNPDTRGGVTLSIPYDRTEAIPVLPNKKPEREPTVYAFDVWVKAPGGRAKRWIEGTATISPASTRPDYDK